MVLRQSKKFRLEDHAIAIGCVTSILVVLGLQWPQMWRYYQESQLQGELTQKARRDAAIARQRFANCNTEFLVNGTPALVAGEIAISSRTGVPLPAGTTVCDTDGRTGVINRDGRIDGVAVSPELKDIFLKQKLGVKHDTK